jgi:hypothetical protein
VIYFTRPHTIISPLIRLTLASLVFLSALIACNSPESVTSNSEGTDTSITSEMPETSDTTAQKITPNTTIHRDTVSIWVYDYDNGIPIKNREVKADTLTPKGLIDFLNIQTGRNRIHLDFVRISDDTIYVKIKESTYLTQSIGTTGADEYMSITTYTLTELKGINYVNFDFEEGDHAVPGTYSRQHYTDRNKQSITHKTN